MQVVGDRPGWRKLLKGSAGAGARGPAAKGQSGKQGGMSVSKWSAACVWRIKGGSAGWQWETAGSCCWPGRGWPQKHALGTLTLRCLSPLCS